MTMHLVGPYMTTTNYNRKKKKKALSANQQEKLMVQWRKHNKDCRRRHIHSAQFEKFEDFLNNTLSSRGIIEFTFFNCDQ